MFSRAASIVMAGAVIAATTSLTNSTSTASPDFTVHEWGTFTTVAGADGRAIEWLPLGGPTDLPCFVKHINPVNLVYKVAPNVQPGSPITYESARTNLWAKVRMETPVLYFYSPTDLTVDINVFFPRGVITEFFPSPVSAMAPLTTTTLRDTTNVGSIGWKNVRVSPTLSPSLFPNGGGESHYYAARATDATPLRIGTEHEKFIFYRGVASFDVPIQTRALANDAVEISNLLPEGSLPTVVLFENRNGRIGYRIVGDVGRSTTVAAPTLDASLPALRADLQTLLVKSGLYEKEAAAMLDTWRDSWFEEGTRVFYVLPSRAVDAILPLHVRPSPSAVSRVFVGRMDVITPTTIRTVKAALEANDTTTLARYSRFLNPITDRIIAGGSDARTNTRIRQVANAVFSNYVKRVQTCE